VRVSSASRCVVYTGTLRGSPSPPTRFAVLLALCGQLAMLAHVALVAHVTCGADGELIHVRADVAAPAREGNAASAAIDAGHDEHDHCLLDEDGEAACPTAHVASGEPVPAARAAFAHGRRSWGVARRAPLYRLAPKNSPPA
jgi:hypothetical protein